MTDKPQAWWWNQALKTSSEAIYDGKDDCLGLWKDLVCERRIDSRSWMCKCGTVRVKLDTMWRGSSEQDKISESA